MKNNRRTRINDEIQRELASIIRELKDPRVSLLTSVLRVETTQDLSVSKVYVSILGEDDEKLKAMEGLNNAAGFIRHELAVRINLRNTPAIDFVFDDSIEYGARMSKLIDEVNKSE